MKITVFTPTYNRAHTLGRVYESLLNQTCKDFIWLIVDDGSIDNSKDIIDNWILEGELQIEYHYKPNGGKHTAMKLAFEITKTKYLIGLDSDDQMAENAIEVFLNEWEIIENTKLEEKIAEIRALSRNINGDLIGNFHFPNNIHYFDLTWHEMVLKKNNFNECISCWNVNKLRECVQIPTKFWLSERANHFGESILWARLGRCYLTRYINRFLLYVHHDGGESILRTGDKKQSHINTIVLNFYLLDENLDYFLLRPSYFIKVLLILIVYSIEYKINVKDTFKHVTSRNFKVLYSLFYPLGILTWSFWKIFLKK